MQLEEKHDYINAVPARLVKLNNNLPTIIFILFFPQCNVDSRWPERTLSDGDFTVAK